ncbi:hypothetical protein [Arthrobacter sp. G119Y2]|uniref:hypothetical protein n=1 Tax=Arthrobacter sp. G119Y2 TaxID=3134965 RepID=UPI00311A23AA
MDSREPVVPPQTETTAVAGVPNQTPGRKPLAPLVFSVSWVRLTGLTLGAMVFVGLGLYICFAGPDLGAKIIGLVCVLFFGGGFAVLLWKKLRDPIVLSLLQWSRGMSGGWDVTFSPHLFRGRAEDAVRKIEGYYLSALIARSGR